MLSNTAQQMNNITSKVAGFVSGQQQLAVA